MVAVFYRYAQYKGFDVSARAELESFADGDSVMSYDAKLFGKDDFSCSAVSDLSLAESSASNVGASFVSTASNLAQTLNVSSTNTEARHIAGLCSLVRETAPRSLCGFWYSLTGSILSRIIE